ncbi:MAG: amidophosphoribosyltransferase, partial [Actinomycetota bacterium]
MSGEARDACGVAAVWAPGEDVARLLFYALSALQHRGQEAAGMGVSDGHSIFVYKDLGLVSKVFDDSVLNSLRGYAGIGHVRYSTTGSSTWENAQPSFKTGPRRQVAIAHNGNLVNSLELARAIDRSGGDEGGRGTPLRASTDTDLVASHIALADYPDTWDAILEVLPRLQGAFSFTLMDEERVFGARDPWGFRPLCIGRLPHGGFILASETCALDLVGATFVRDVAPGELVELSVNGLRSERFRDAPSAACLFEHVYFARPDSNLMGSNVYASRYRMGQRLAAESPAVADLVVPVPESGVPAAQGFAQHSQIAYGEGFVKNRYVGRTFIQPTQSMRRQGIRMKLNPLKEMIAGKRLVVVEDSIVRANTTIEIIRMLREAGAREVHMRISSAPIRWPCFYGIDMPDRDELVAARLDSLDEVRAHVGADSLAYLSVEGMVEATGIPSDAFCTACFTS